jgi:hypothetical protein
MATSEGVLPTSEGCIPTSERLYSAKQAILREIKGLFCAYQHVANTKFARKCTFYPKNDLFWEHLRFLLLPNRYTRPQGGILYRRHPACIPPYRRRLACSLECERTKHRKMQAGCLRYGKAPGQDAPETRRLEVCDTRCSFSLHNGPAEAI